jgi:tRNA (guanine-N(7)-)-methyltransferase subunit TRM82
MPILDFTIHNGFIWVCLDDSTLHVGTGENHSVPRRPRARQVRIQSGKFEEMQGEMCSALNASDHLLEASPADMNSLQLYAALSSMPKHGDFDQDAVDRETLLTAGPGPKQSKKELGRLKSKLALVNKDSAAVPQAKKMRSDAQV